MSALSLDNVTVSANNKTLLNNVTCCFEAGKITAIIGKNGAGKSTLIKAVAGDANTLSGTITLNDQNLASISSIQRARQLAVLPQNSLLNSAFSVREVIQLGRCMHDTGIEIDNRIIENIINTVDILHLEHRNYLSLSGGEKQRTQLARVLVQITQDEKDDNLDGQGKNKLLPRVLLLDEPANALDLKYQKKLMQTLRLVAKKNVAVVMVVHDLNHAAYYADSIVALDNGHIKIQGLPRDVLTAPVLEDIFDTPINVVTLPNKTTVIMTV